MDKKMKFRWIDNADRVGEHEFTFDGKKIYNLFRDYPYELTAEEKEMFDKENPFWADFFKDRYCDHDWYLAQADALHKNMANGPDQMFDLYRCSKCGKTEMRRQY